jgi:hypothetical protein
MDSRFTRRGFLAAGAVAPHLMAQSKPAAPVQFRTLGRTGLKVSTVGFGCMITSDPSVIERAVDAGINYFDTARVYSGGNNERMVGAALKPHRKNLIISTKSKAQDRAGLMAHLETSLKDLQTDYVDIWYLHSKDRADQVTDEIVEAQQEAIKQGKVRFSGLSLHNGHAEVIPATIAKKKIDVVLTTYNFAMGPQMEPIIKQLHDAGLGVVAMKVMAGSLNLDRSYDFNRAKQAMEKPGAPLAALKWSLRVPWIHTSIPSIKDVDQLEEDLRAMREPYTKDDSVILAKQLDRITPLYCRTCGTCRGVCPQGLPVSDVLRILTYSEGYGEFDLARERFLELTPEQQAVKCADCSKCAIECPNGVRVQDRLVRAQELFA